MFGNQRSRPAPRRDRVERLHEAGPDEGAGAVALAPRPAERVKLADQFRNLGRVEKGRNFLGDRAPWYRRNCQASYTSFGHGSRKLQLRGGHLFALVPDSLGGPSDGVGPPLSGRRATLLQVKCGRALVELVGNRTDPG